MKRRSRRISVLEESDFDAFQRTGPAFELPPADDFVCTNEEVREACALLRRRENLEGLLPPYERNDYAARRLYPDLLERPPAAL